MQGYAHFATQQSGASYTRVLMHDVIAAHGLSLVAASGSYSVVAVCGFLIAVASLVYGL